MPSKKDVATTIFTLGLSYLWRKFIAKRVAKRLPGAVLDVLDVARGSTVGTVPAGVAHALDDIALARLEAGLAAIGNVADSFASHPIALSPTVAKLLALRQEAIEHGKTLALEHAQRLVEQTGRKLPSPPPASTAAPPRPPPRSNTPAPVPPPRRRRETGR